ncbi:hypothetical protein KGM48_01585 [Patescibacteria group bacterium]|nr:hypothetical protein [Patescibacteria group bacterium]
MLKNPYQNAVLAAAYVVGVVYALQTLGAAAALQKTVLIPIAVLGLLVLSVAVMILLFIVEPYRLFASGQREHAVTVFAKTVLAFGGLVVLYLAALMTLVR